MHTTLLCISHVPFKQCTNLSEIKSGWDRMSPSAGRLGSTVSGGRVYPNLGGWKDTVPWHRVRPPFAGQLEGHSL